MSMKKSAVFLYVLVAAGLVLLLYNAATTTVWDDETNGFFLAREPLPQLMQMMAANVHEDPPLFDLVLHFWISLAGYEPLALRLLPVFFWILTLVGLHKAGDKMGGEGAGLLCVAVAVWMPYHWMFPAAMRWYSLFACLAVWNFIAFLRLTSIGQEGGGLRKSRLPLLWYVLSGGRSGTPITVPLRFSWRMGSLRLLFPPFVFVFWGRFFLAGAE